MQNLELKAGELVVFSEGQYSDYGYRGSYVVLQDISADEMQAIADEVRARDKSVYSSDTIAMFEPELIRRGYLAIINMREIHLGDYHGLDVR